MKRILTLAGLLVLLLTPATVPAQQNAWYRVELIIFQQWEAGGPDAEAAPLEPPPPQADQVTDLAPAGSGAGTPFRELTGNQLALHGVYDVLEKDDSYQPLLHVGWVQPGLSAERAPAVAIPPDWRPQAPGADFQQPPALRGFVQVYAERYLHVRTDLRYRKDGYGSTEVMQGSRRMRSGELHYLDHPVLGMIVQVTRL